MSKLETKTLTSNSLLPVSFLVMTSFSNPIQEIPKPNVLSNRVEFNDTMNVFCQLPNQNIKYEESQITDFVSFISKLMNESKDLDDEIVDMVNQHFWDLI